MRQIIAIGGGGFGRNSDADHIEQYILDQSKKSRPNINYLINKIFFMLVAVILKVCWLFGKNGILINF